MHSTIKRPAWLKVAAPVRDSYFKIHKLMSSRGLHTVCQSANCPNIAQCWDGGTATFMLLGNNCTRACRFCSINTKNPNGFLDKDEAKKVANAIKMMNLKYVVLTSVDRDDLPDQGSTALAETIGIIFRENQDLLIEILSPDFLGNKAHLKILLDSKPHVFAHNIETVKRLSPSIRDRRASYQTSLDVLKNAKEINPQLYTKSSLMLGLGEGRDEVIKTLKDLRKVNVDILTLGQYLSPTEKLARHLPVKRYVPPKEFDEWKLIAENLKFRSVLSGPLVRSSYRAGEYFVKKFHDHI